MNVKAITYTTILGVLIFAACKKGDSVSADNNASTSNCVVQQSAENGRLITDQYIIAYNTSTSSRHNTGITSIQRFLPHCQYRHC